MAAQRSAAFLDRPLARGLAALVLIACITLLAWIERARWLPGDPVAALDPAAACLAERAAQIDGMLDDGVIEAGQAELFKSRAAAMCQSMQGGASGPGLPPLPGQ